jgi:hypothetical protein
MSDEVEITEETIEELRNGTSLKVEVDPEDDRFMVVSFRRPRGPDDEVRAYEGAELSLGKFLKMACAYATGFGLGRMVQRGERLVAMLDYTGIQIYAGEVEPDPAPKIIMPTQH